MAIVVVVAAAALRIPLVLLGGSSGRTITVGDRSCAPQWSAARTGRHTYRVTNTGPSPEEVSIVGPDHRTVYAELEMVAPGTTRTMVAILGPGRYSWDCEADDGTRSYSDPQQVRGPRVRGAPSFIPVDYNQLSGAVELYRASVKRGLGQLGRDVDRLAGTVKSGRLAAARDQWLAAHLDYARLGAAYGSFGDFADRIDGRADGLVGGVRSPKFTGFLRLEYGLWHGQSAAKLAPVATALDRAVRGLAAAFAHQSTDPNDVALRAHEILEDTLQFELTGDTDEGSHTNLATAAANVAGTRLTLAALTPLLRQIDPGLLTRVTADLDRLASLVGSYRRPGGDWTPLQSLSRAQRERLDSAVGNTLEELAPLPDHLDILLTHDNNN